MGKYERRRGATFELEVAAALRRVYPNAKRGIGQARNGGDVPDVDGTPWWVECKRGASCSAHAAIAQARANRELSAKAGGRYAEGNAIAVLRRDNEKAIVVLDLETFIALCHHLNKPNAEGV